MTFETSTQSAATSPAIRTVAAKPEPDEVIVVDNLWKTYNMGAEQVHALRGVNLRIRHNEYVPSWDLPAPANPP